MPCLSFTKKVYISHTHTHTHTQTPCHDQKSYHTHSQANMQYAFHASHTQHMHERTHMHAHTHTHHAMPPFTKRASTPQLSQCNAFMHPTPSSNTGAILEKSSAWRNINDTNFVWKIQVQNWHFSLRNVIGASVVWVQVWVHVWVTLDKDATVAKGRAGGMREKASRREWCLREPAKDCSPPPPHPHPPR